MKYLTLFCLGVIADRYIFPLLDIVLETCMNKHTYNATKIQYMINELANENQEVNTNAIGFQYTPEEEYLEYEEE